MDGEAQLADLGTLGQPARHHPPADGALQAAEHEQQADPAAHVARNRPCRGEIEERHEEDEADRAAEQAVRPFPPEDGLEAVEGHVAVHDLILRDLLVLLEFLLPFGVGQRRHDAVDRLPFGDRETGLGHPGRPADDDHRHDEEGDGPEPCPHGPVAAGGGRRRARRRAVSV
jgi:hypothetical protein